MPGMGANHPMEMAPDAHAAHSRRAAFVTPAYLMEMIPRPCAPHPRQGWSVGDALNRVRCGRPICASWLCDRRSHWARRLRCLSLRWPGGRFRVSGAAR
jgi:hypothetical protein